MGRVTVRVAVTSPQNLVGAARRAGDAGCRVAVPLRLAELVDPEIAEPGSIVPDPTAVTVRTLFETEPVTLNVSAAIVEAVPVPPVVGEPVAAKVTAPVA